MTVIYAASSIIPSKSANSVHVMKVCNAMAKNGNNVTLVVPDSKDIERNIDDAYAYYGVDKTFKLIKIKLRIPFTTRLSSQRFGFGIARYIKKQNIGNIYSRDLYTCFFLAKIFKVPFVFEWHDSFKPRSIDEKLFRAMIKTKYFTKIVVITQSLKEYFINTYNIEESKILVAPDGADEVPSGLTPAQLVEASKDKFNICYIGHLYKDRGIEMLGEIAHNCPFAFFHIVGGTEKDVAAWKEKYKDITNIHFYGHVPPAQTVRYGIAMDVMIIPYMFHPYPGAAKRDEDSTVKWMSPLKLFEYMMLGKPIICSDLPVLREVMTDGENGILCPVADIEAWSAAIKKLYDDESYAKKMGQGALQASKKYTWRVRSENVLKFAFNIQYYGFDKKHVFFGYYDLQQINADGTKMLVHVADKKAQPGKDIAEIGFFNISSGDYHKIATTKAWCWQQGARLRWHPLQPDKILYNDISDDNKNYVTREYDISTGKTRTVAPALYDLSSDNKYGISVNFSRLERLRPGYGYSILPDETTGKSAPEDDGVHLIDLESNTSKLIIPLHELAIKYDKDLTNEHYINHVSFCPDNKKFIFFHVEKTSAPGIKRKIRLYLYDIELSQLMLLEDKMITSHYTWRNDNELLTTSSPDGVKVEYAIYNISAGTRNIIDHDALRGDGHPSFFANGNIFVSDTKPDKRNMQKLFTYDIENKETKVLSEFYHKPVRSIDRRCDLHPRLRETVGKHVITADTTCKGGVRKVVMISS